MKNKQKENVLLIAIVIIAVLVIAGLMYYSKNKSTTYQTDTQNQAGATYSSEKYKVSLKYPSGWIVKETDPYLQDSNTAQVTFYKNDQHSSTDIQKAALTLRVVKNGDQKFGTRDWQYITVGANKFNMNCENGPLGGFATSCEIVPSTNGEIAYVIYANNPNTDSESKEILTSLQIK